MQKEETIKRIDYFTGMQQEMQKFVNNFITDKSYPLEDRWEVFAYACKKDILTEIYDYYYSSPILDKLGKDSWYDEFYIERYQTAYFTNIVETIEDSFVGEEEGINGWTKELVNNFKEELLASGQIGFVMDW